MGLTKYKMNQQRGASIPTVALIKRTIRNRNGQIVSGRSSSHKPVHLHFHTDDTRVAVQPSEVRLAVLGPYANKGKVTSAAGINYYEGSSP
jgi:hypothetical protein